MGKRPEIDFSKLPQPRSDGMRYILNSDYTCQIPYIGLTFPLSKGMMIDGATWARDLGVAEGGWHGIWAFIIGWIFKTKNVVTDCMWGHDEICNTGKVNGIPVCNFVASLILACLLIQDGYYREAPWWFLGTLLAGGGEARKNGMFFVKKERYEC